MRSRACVQLLEDGGVVVTEAVGSVEFPARFTLVAAANPCPCGFEGDQRVTADAGQTVSISTGRSSRVRCSIASTCGCRCRLTKHELMGSGQGEPRPRSATGCSGPSRPPASPMGGARRGLQRAPAGPDRPAPGAPDDRCRAVPRGRGRRSASPTGVRLAIKVARTVADLAGAEVVGPGPRGRGALLSRRRRAGRARPCRLSSAGAGPTCLDGRSTCRGVPRRLRRGLGPMTPCWCSPLFVASSRISCTSSRGAKARRTQPRGDPGRGGRQRGRPCVGALARST